MPGRTIPLITDELYHVFNRGTARQPIFLTKRDYDRFTEILRYYLPVKPPIRYSRFLMLTTKQREEFFSRKQRELVPAVTCIAYCVMPNHFHLVLRQETDGGISKYLANICNSYTRYINTKKKRQGPLLQGKFKAVRIEDDEQLLHLVRYVHLNPYSNALVRSVDDVFAYPYSSLPLYIRPDNHSWVEGDLVLSQFKTRNSFASFTADQANYQKHLEAIKHLALDHED